MIHKRSLPLLSYLSSTHLAAAEKKRKKEEKERQNSIAEEEAKKALLRNPINATVESEKTQPTNVSSDGVGLAKNQVNAVGDENPNKPQATATPTATVTTTMEKTSNILMPPLLKDFLKQLEKKA